jgi:hypothetical protein
MSASARALCVRRGAIDTGGGRPGYSETTTRNFASSSIITIFPICICHINSLHRQRAAPPDFDNQSPSSFLRPNQCPSPVLRAPATRLATATLMAMEPWMLLYLTIFALGCIIQRKDVPKTGAYI